MVSLSCEKIFVITPACKHYTIPMVGYIYDTFLELLSYQVVH